MRVRACVSLAGAVGPNETLWVAWREADHVTVTAVSGSNGTSAHRRQLAVDTSAWVTIVTVTVLADSTVDLGNSVQSVVDAPTALTLHLDDALLLTNPSISGPCPCCTCLYQGLVWLL